MTITVHAFGAYRTVLTGGRSREELQMSSVVKIIKKDATAIRATDMTDLDGMPVKLSTGHRDDVLRMFGKWGSRHLQTLGAANAVIVGVPGSSHTTADGNFTAGRMAAAVARYGAGEAKPILYFSQAMRPAHEGNKQAREINFLVSVLACTEQEVTGAVVLVDDVVTTGAHMVACARKLRVLGASVKIGLCAARTVREAVPDPLNLPPFTITT
jgi:hypothetical protein